MTLIPPGSGRRRPTEQEVIALELVSGLLMIIGLAAFAYLFYAIATNGQIREATQKIIDPRNTRPFLINALRWLGKRKQDLPERKHENMRM